MKGEIYDTHRYHKINKYLLSKNGIHVLKVFFMLFRLFVEIDHAQSIPRKNELLFVTVPWQGHSVSVI